ncbi:UNVERIFIED_CONTAM: DJ-1/PfpI family protein [Campylobacter lari]
MKLLVLLHNEFNDMELCTTLSILDRANVFDKTTLYNPKLKSVAGQHNIVKLDLENNVDFNEYDAIFIPGGKGAKALRKDNESLCVIKEFIDKNKYIFSICDAPNVLIENNLIPHNIPYSSYPIESISLTKGENRNNAYATAYQKIITGKCPTASAEFALLIIKKLKGKEEADKIRKIIYAL